jgi:hypothetical protein
MNKKDFIDEMLLEVKNLKDLAKDELPEIAKEYIIAKKIQAFIGLVFGILIILLASSASAYYFFGTLESHSDSKLGLVVFLAVAFLLGFLITFSYVDGLLDLYLQPRRMAIYAITSLKG